MPKLRISAFLTKDELSQMNLLIKRKQRVFQLIHHWHQMGIFGFFSFTTT